MTKKWEGIVIHHTASPSRVWTKDSSRKISVNDVRNWHINQNFGDIGYHYLIDGQGFIFKGRDRDKTGAHCRPGRRNHISLGVCLTGNFQYDSPSQEQMSSLIMLVRYLQEKYKIKKEMIELHGKVEGAQTLCPGRYFPEEYFYKSISEYEDSY